MILILGAAPLTAAHRQAGAKSPSKAPVKAPAKAAVKADASAASLLPQEIGFFVEIQDLAALRDGLTKSISISRAREIPRASSAAEAGSFLEALSFGLTSKAAMKQTRVAFAESAGANPRERARILFAVAPDESVSSAAEPRLKEWFSRWIADSNAQEVVSPPNDRAEKTRDAGGFISGHQGRVAFVGESSLVAAMKDRIGNRALPSLSQSKTFADAAAKLAGQHQVFAFFSRGAISEIVQRSLQSLDPDTASVGRTAVDFVNLDGVDALAVGASFGLRGASEQFQIYKNPQSSSILNVVFDASNGSVGVFGNATKKASTAVEYHFDYTKLFDSLLDLFGPLLAVQAGAESPQAALANYESELGLNIREELLPSFGDGVAVIIEPRTDSKEDANESVLDVLRERGVLLLPVRDRAKFAAAFEKVRHFLNRPHDGRPPVLKPATRYRGVELIHERGAAMAYLGDRFAIAREANLKRLIDARASGETLSKAPAIARLFGKASAASAGTIFLDASHGSSSQREFISRLAGVPVDRIDASRLASQPFLLMKLTHNSSGLAGTSESPVGILGGLLMTLRPVGSAIGPVKH